MQSITEQLLARQKIPEMLSRYARGTNRADAELLKSCYHPGAVAEHGGSPAGNARDYVNGAIPRILGMGSMQHLPGSTCIEFDGDLARVTNVLTFLRMGREGGPWDALTGGRLLDRFERRDGDCKIMHRRTVFDWNRDMPANETWCLGFFDPDVSGMLHGSKGAEDPSYERE